MLILVGLVFKNLRNSGMGSKIIRGRSPSSTRAPPPPPQLLSTTISTGQLEQDLRFRGVQSGIFRGSKPGISWSMSGGGRPVKVLCL